MRRRITRITTVFAALIIVSCVSGPATLKPDYKNYCRPGLMYLKPTVRRKWVRSVAVRGAEREVKRCLAHHRYIHAHNQAVMEIEKCRLNCEAKKAGIFGLLGLIIGVILFL